VHQGVVVIVIVPVALVVHARPFVAAVTLAEFARIIPSSVRYRPSLLLLAVWLVRERRPGSFCEGWFREAPRRRAFRRGVQRVVSGNAGSGPLRASERGSGPRAPAPRWAGSRPGDQKTASRPYTPFAASGAGGQAERGTVGV
jgi:hypothetical protein